MVCPKFYTGADTGFPEGVGGEDIPQDLKTPPLLDIRKHPPPLDIACVASSALREIEKHPHSWTFASTPPPRPLDIACVASSTFQGWGAIGPAHEHFAIGFQYRDKFKGGVIIPVTPPPPDLPLDKSVPVPTQKIVPVPLLLNLYLPIELRASYLMRSALIATYW